MSRDLAAEYYAAALASRQPAATLRERAAAWDRMEEIYEASDYTLPVLDIDEAARLALYHPNGTVR